MIDKATLEHSDRLPELDRPRLEQNLPPVVSPPTAGRGLLAVGVGDWKLMFAMDEITEIVPLPRITRVPGMQPWLLGIANLRGNVIAVIDLKVFLGDKPAGFLAGSRLLMVRSGEWHYGLVVDEIIGMRHFGPEQEQNEVATLPAGLQPYLTRIFVSEQTQWLVFDVNRLLHDPKFLQATSR
ncbi:MAG: chemotaxis protein CheW [Candidatus Competibacteraceae bacterium]